MPMTKIGGDPFIDPPPVSFPKVWVEIPPFSTRTKQANRGEQQPTAPTNLTGFTTINKTVLPASTHGIPQDLHVSLSLTLPSNDSAQPYTVDASGFLSKKGQPSASNVWCAPGSLSIPGSKAMYTLVSLTFHHPSKVADASSQYDEGGHFTSLLRHIGSSSVLAYNDLRSSIIQPAAIKQQEEFYAGNTRSKTTQKSAYAVYYLLGGEQVQEELYHQQLHHLAHHFGITVDPESPTSHLPSRISLSAFLDADLQPRPLPQDSEVLPNTFNARFQQGYQRPKPKAKFLEKGNVVSRPVSSPLQPPSHYILQDPSEQFYLQEKEDLEMPIVFSPLLEDTQPTISLLISPPAVVLQAYKWDQHAVQSLALWDNASSDSEDEETAAFAMDDDAVANHSPAAEAMLLHLENLSLSSNNPGASQEYGFQYYKGEKLKMILVASTEDIQNPLGNWESCGSDWLGIPCWTKDDKASGWLRKDALKFEVVGQWGFESMDPVSVIQFNRSLAPDDALAQAVKLVRIQLLIQYWATKFLEEVDQMLESGLLAADTVISFVLAPFQTFHITEHDPQNSSNWRSFTPSDWLVLSPLISPNNGNQLETISGTDGSFDPEWRAKDNPWMVKSIRMLRAFQHYVMWKTRGTVLVSNFEGWLEDIVHDGEPQFILILNHPKYHRLETTNINVSGLLN
ncbi:hypothetical protein DL93DRAFT_2173792 [Clavulina sp. PMI_390]|nr:hypothetical protein DL93DRAFT_2173792 [Clavulina sp. PMI_390]